MTLRSDQQEKKSDWFKWCAVFVFLLAGIVANYYYSEASALLRGAAGVVVVALCALIAATTQKGKWSIGFMKDSRMELRKVVWPTRDEVMQTTIVVAVMVVILALLLWGMDGLLVWIIGWLTGQRS